MILEIILGSIIILSIIVGLTKGFVKEFLCFVGIIIAIIVASYLYKRFATVLPWDPTISNIVSFFSIFITVALLFYLISLLIEKSLHLGVVNRLLGMIFGLIKGIIISGIVSLLLSFIPQTEKVVKNSKVALFSISGLKVIKSLFPYEMRKKLTIRAPRV